MKNLFKKIAFSALSVVLACGMAFGASGCGEAAVEGYVGVKTYKQIMSAFQDMVNGKVDAVIIDDMVANNLVASYKGKKEVTANVLKDAGSENYGLCVAKGNNELLEKINTFLAKEETIANIETSVKYHSGASETTIVYPDLTDNNGGTITMCTEAGFAPYEYQKNEGAGVYMDKSGAGIAGLDVDVMILFCEEYNYKLEISNMDFDGALLAVEQDKTNMFVGAAGITISDERQAKMGMSNAYVKNVQQSIISLKANNYSTKEALKGKVVACQLGTSGNFVLEDWNA